MTRWSFRLNLPGRGRYEPPTPHIPTEPPAGDEPAEDPPATPGRAPANRSPRFRPQPTGEQP